MSVNMNALHNVSNPNQGKAKRVLCVCSAGLLRSPTAALVLSQEPYNFNTRAAGANPEYALIPVSPLLLHWADEIVFMQKEHQEAVGDIPEDKDVIVLDIPDTFRYRDERLMALIQLRYDYAQRILRGEETP